MGFLSFLEDAGHDVENMFKWGVKQGTNVITHTEDTISDTISTPLIILAVGVAFFLYNSNLAQGAEVAKNVAPLAMM